MAKKSLIKAKTEHDKWLRNMGLQPYKGRLKKRGVTKIPDYSCDPLPSNVSISNKVGSCELKVKPKYTGTYIKGVVTSHKSNLMPITSDKQAVDAAQMRRN